MIKVLQNMPRQGGDRFFGESGFLFSLHFPDTLHFSGFTMKHACLRMLALFWRKNFSA
jgi:hypothetical protein